MAKRSRRWRRKQRRRRQASSSWIVDDLKRYFTWCRKHANDGHIHSSGLLRTVVDERRPEVARQAEQKAPPRIFWEAWAPDGEFVCSYLSRRRVEDEVRVHRAVTGLARKDYVIRRNLRSPDLVGPKLTARGAETRATEEHKVLAWRTPGDLRRIAMAIGALEEHHRKVIEAHFGWIRDHAGDHYSARRRAQRLNLPWGTYCDRLKAAKKLLEIRLGGPLEDE